MVNDAIDTFAGLLPPPPNAATSWPDQVSATLTKPEAIGRYIIQDELGRGGLGVVYRAYDPTLKRSVAVKVLLSGQWAGQEARDRFRAEAESVARLSHRHIVQVYEVGEADGRLYVALELVDGPTLAAVLAAAPLPPNEAAALVAALAEAVFHAHQQGVVHRDLKPANVLLSTQPGRNEPTSQGPASAELMSRFEPKIADFGLAKRLDDDSHLTRTGVLVGTPRYMAPEQANGTPEGAMPGVDVYALGAILYECLTGHPPFQAASVIGTLDLVRTTDPVPPRRLQPHTPRDLDVICLHCLAKAPARRYATADDLAAELRRFLAGRPLVARPLGLTSRSVRWAKRDPVKAAFIGFVLLFLVAVVAGVTWHTVRLQDALDTITAREAETAQAKQRADQAKDQANANYRYGHDTIQQMVARLESREYAGIPKLQELRRRQLEDALAFALKVSAQAADAPEVQADVGWALQDAGFIHRSLGRDAEAEANFRAAADRFTALAERFPVEPVYRRAQATALLQLWGYAEQAGHHAEAERIVREVIALREQLHMEFPESHFDTSELAQAYANLGTLFNNRAHRSAAERDRHRTAAEREHRRAAELNEAIVAAEPTHLGHKRRLAACWTNLSMVTMLLPGRTADAEKDHDRAVKLYEELLRADPGDVNTMLDFAQLRTNWANALIDRMQFDQALADLAKNLQEVGPLYEREPNSVHFRTALYHTYGVTSLIHERRQDWAAAATAYRKVVEYDPVKNNVISRMILALNLARAGTHAEATVMAEAIAAELPATAPAEQWEHLASVAAVSRTQVLTRPAPDQAARAERYAELAARMLARANAASDPKKWAADLPKLLRDPDLAPVANHPAVRAAVGEPTK